MPDQAELPLPFVNDEATPEDPESSTEDAKAKQERPRFAALRATSARLRLNKRASSLSRLERQSTLPSPWQASALREGAAYQRSIRAQRLEDDAEIPTSL